LARHHKGGASGWSRRAIVIERTTSAQLRPKGKGDPKYSRPAWPCHLSGLQALRPDGHVVLDDLPIRKTLKARLGAHDGGVVHKDVWPTGIWHNKAITLLEVEELDHPPLPLPTAHKHVPLPLPPALGLRHCSSWWQLKLLVVLWLWVRLRWQLWVPLFLFCTGAEVRRLAVVLPLFRTQRRVGCKVS